LWQDEQQSNEVLFSPLLPECTTLERVSASSLSLHLSYSLFVASLSASTVIPSTIGKSTRVDSISSCFKVLLLCRNSSDGSRFLNGVCTASPVSL
jgi:hypothetical protein